MNKRLFTTILLLTTYIHISAREIVTSWHDDITIHKNGILTVTETISVISEQKSIRHGIYRSFPTRYKDSMGNNFVVDFNVKSVTRNGKSIPYDIKNKHNGVFIYMRDIYKKIPRGKHTFKLTYTTNRQIGFFKTHDELFFNIIGNGFDLPIQKASATIYLPKNIPNKEIKLYGRVGRYDSKEDSSSGYIDNNNICYFSTNRHLNPKEAFTVSIVFPKGHITPPTINQKIEWFFKDNLIVLLYLLSLFILLTFYFTMWLKVRMPKPVITPLFNPPKDLLPASAAYIFNKSFNDKALTSSIIDMAVNGYLKIDHSKGDWFSSDTYSLIKLTKNKDPDNSPYQRLSLTLFKENDVISVTEKNYKIFQSAKITNKDFIYKKYKDFVTSNSSTVVTGVLFTAIVSTAALSQQQPIVSILLLGLHILTNISFLQLLKQPTTLGLPTYTELLGFKMYLEYTEKDRIHRLNPPKKTIDLFEKYLPYAIALGVEKQWSKEFDSLFAQMKNQGTPYHPIWFNGRHFNLSVIDSFSSSFSNSIAASSSPPGSRSSAGGSGGAGGGGGGGGGGGC